MRIVDVKGTLEVQTIMLFYLPIISQPRILSQYILLETCMLNAHLITVRI